MEALRDGRDVRASLMSQRGDSIICHILFSALPIVSEAGISPDPETRRLVAYLLKEKGVAGRRQEMRTQRPLYQTEISQVPSGRPSPACISPRDNPAKQKNDLFAESSTPENNTARSARFACRWRCGLLIR